MSRQVAILSGGDWYDASVEHLTVPDGIDLKAVNDEWQKWYAEVYVPWVRLPHGEERERRAVKYVWFVDFLCERGATDGTVEEYTVN